MSELDVRRARITVAEGLIVDGWVAEYDGTEAVGHGREEALRRLVKAVAQEAL